MEIAIGLSLVYLLLSLICSAVSEGLETILKNRSRDLERGLREMLSDEDGSKLVHLLYNHPLIQGLFRDRYSNDLIRKRLLSAGKVYAGKTLPSYIPPRHFALALMDIIVPVSADSPSGASGALGTSSAAATAPTIATLRAAAAAFPVPQVSRAVMLMIDASANDITRVRESFESWFDSSMERVAGWYKRRAQIIIFAVAIAASGVLNLDTVEIARRLATDSAMRSSLVATATEYAKQKDLNLPSMKEDIDHLSLGIPVGWDAAPATTYQWLLKLMGILASAMAATLGAPFWFDVLNRFISGRSSNKPKQKWPDAHSNGF
ncbi:MAG TPA: hypothetical protein VGE93_21260, partial [Bryobacteraceae bacterium]